jgi:hypothetical protein
LPRNIHFSVPENVDGPVQRKVPGNFHGMTQKHYSRKMLLPAE